MKKCRCDYCANKYRADIGGHVGVKVNSDVTKEAVACGVLEEGNKVKIKQLKVTPRKTYDVERKKS